MRRSDCGVQRPKIVSKAGPLVARSMEDADTQILRPGDNCWRIDQARRVAFLVDGCAYFDAFAEAAIKAQHSIMLVGWDTDSRVRLWPRWADGPCPVELGDFLNALVVRRRHLHIYLLTWDFSMVFALEREAFPVFKLGIGTHRRVHFHLDGTHAPGASHHQKIVVIDDKVAFTGGLDLTIRRWDTPAHLSTDPRRVDPAGKPYGPFHDVQVVLDGGAARALGDLARQRWQDATGAILTPPPACRDDPWPSRVPADLHRVSVGIARTAPPFRGHPGTTEVSRLYVDMIAAARRWIYVENQYFTSAAVGDALAARLGEPTGPEVIVVLPCQTSGWIQESTMGALRAALIASLTRADTYGRLRFFYPAIEDLQNDYLKVHSKIMIVDDRIVRVGSANLSNRSMGLDTECDIAIEAGGHDDLRHAIASFRDRLLAEHLDCRPEAVSNALLCHHSLIAAITALATRPRRLELIQNVIPANLDQLLPNAHLVDSIRPIEAEALIEEFVPEEVRAHAHRRLLRNAALAVALLLLAGAWHWTPLGRWFNVDQLMEWTETLRSNRLAPLLVVAAFVLGGFVMFPITLLIVATAVSFPWPQNFIYAFSGSMFSSISTYGLGRLMDRKSIQRMAGERLSRLGQRLAKRGLATIITLRLIPVAPHSFINLVAGALRVRFRDLAIGTALGMLPGILAVTFFTETLTDVLRHPGWHNYLMLAGLTIASALAGFWMKRWIGRPGGIESRVQDP